MADTPTPNAAGIVTEPINDHPEFAGAEAPKDKTAAVKAVKPLNSKPWQPQAAVTTAQVSDVINQAKAAAASGQFLFDQPIAHPSIGENGRLVKLMGDTATIRYGNGEMKDFPKGEIFDPTVAEDIAASLVNAEPVQQNKPPVTGPAKPAGGSGSAPVVTALMAALLLSFSFLGVACETTGSQQIKGTAAAKVREVVTLSEPEIRPLAALATDGVFAFALTPAQRDATIAATSKIVGIVSAASGMTPDQFQAALLAALPPDPQYQEMSASLTHIYSLGINLLSGDPKLLLKAAVDIAAGINDSINAWKRITSPAAATIKTGEFRLNRPAVLGYIRNGRYYARR
jgi:hypothetical protein